MVVVLDVVVVTVEVFGHLMTPPDHHVLSSIAAAAAAVCPSCFYVWNP